MNTTFKTLLTTSCCFLFSTIAFAQATFTAVSVEGSITQLQPMTGLVLWPDQAADLDATYNKSITLEYSYCLPCDVVTGKQDGKIVYDWSSLETLLNDIKSRNHQAVVRFRYEYPSGDKINGVKGATAVPQYIKDLSDYKETYSANPGGDGPTYYADWSNSELQWFTKQFYTDFAAQYGTDPRIAFIEVGFGHWSEYHIYGTTLKLGENFPSHAYQKEFLQHMANVMPIPWSISIDAADEEYSPIINDNSLLALHFGLFDDSFMHKEHEIGSGDGYNEECWNAIGQGTRWQKGVCGGEISYYTSNDQKNFLNPDGMYGVTWENAAAKYHLTFMIANDAPEGKNAYNTAARFKECSAATGYRFKVVNCETDGASTRITMTNTGIAPIYRDAYVVVDGVRAAESLKGLLPGEQKTFSISAAATATNVSIQSDCILPSQEIQFEGIVAGAGGNDDGNAGGNEDNSGDSGDTSTTGPVHPDCDAPTILAQVTDLATPTENYTRDNISIGMNGATAIYSCKLQGGGKLGGDKYFFVLRLDGGFKSGDRIRVVSSDKKDLKLLAGNSVSHYGTTTYTMSGENTDMEYILTAEAAADFNAFDNSFAILRNDLTGGSKQNHHLVSVIVERCIDLPTHIESPIATEDYIIAQYDDHIEVGGNKPIHSLRLLNMSGQEVISSTHHSIRTHTLPTGIYILHIKGDITTFKKIIIP